MAVTTAPAALLRYIPLSHNSADSQASALRLLFALFPDWETSEGKVELVRFTDGITNTLLKAVKRRPGSTETQVDGDTVLLRAYGKGTEVLIDRERETVSHALLASYRLAPPLLARFQNGLMYRFIQGRACTSADLTREPVWRGVARRLGEWHAVVPVASVPRAAVEERGGDKNVSLSKERAVKMPSAAAMNAITPGKVTPNTWTVMQRWIFALPTTTPAEAARKQVLQTELERTVRELGHTPGLGEDGLVFGHCDLLSGNVIIQPRSRRATTQPSIETAAFIDYEYATPSPAAFDLANHFSEWGGFECDYGLLPTRATRRAFLREYLRSYRSHRAGPAAPSAAIPCPPSPKASAEPDPNFEAEVSRLFAEVDAFRGIPGFYWGVWALVQAGISQIDFDYASYAEVRLGEYWAWRGEGGGLDGGKGAEREKRWEQEA